MAATEAGLLRHRSECYRSSMSDLHAELTRLSNACDEIEFEAALTEAATRIQGLVLNASHDISQLLTGLPPHFHPLLYRTLERAISIHALPDGAVLRLWALPAVLQVAKIGRQLIEVPTGGLNLIRLNATLHANLAMPGTGGWSNMLPVLLSDTCRQGLTLHQLIEAPRRMRQYIRGEASMPFIRAEDCPAIAVKPGLYTYSVPFVSYQPPGAQIGAGSSSPELTHTLTAWLSSLPDGRSGNITVRWVGRPRAFSQLVEDGDARWPVGLAGYPSYLRH
ncbi:hypothetical protein VVD49_18495 [Uliginosibacterium sp. H3]|uniref:Uncharacterized protein n=1 Tax=Uliginosibacterium silvisoli TaxID=3114758 RepID=A0ABU6K758_9RHOO|nr:hypothetical protein [Uliginosibacterium sp. H3]